MRKWKEMENGRMYHIEYLRIQGIDGNIVYFTNLFLGFSYGIIRDVLMIYPTGILLYVVKFAKNKRRMLKISVFSISVNVFSKMHPIFSILIKKIAVVVSFLAF